MVAKFDAIASILRLGKAVVDRAFCIRDLIAVIIYCRDRYYDL